MKKIVIVVICFLNSFVFAQKDNTQFCDKFTKIHDLVSRNISLSEYVDKIKLKTLYPEQIYGTNKKIYESKIEIEDTTDSELIEQKQNVIFICTVASFQNENRKSENLIAKNFKKKILNCIKLSDWEIMKNPPSKIKFYLSNKKNDVKISLGLMEKNKVRKLLLIIYK